MNEAFRGPLVVLELAALVTILAIVDDPLLRVSLGLVVGLLLARGALIGSAEDLRTRPPPGSGDRRSDYLYRHWINALLKKVRELHTVCHAVRSGGVNVAVGQLRIAELEREIRQLLNQVTESAKPQEMKRRRRSNQDGERRPGVYGESVDTPVP